MRSESGPWPRDLVPGAQDRLCLRAPGPCPLCQRFHQAWRSGGGRSHPGGWEGFSGRGCDERGCGEHCRCVSSGKVIHTQRARLRARLAPGSALLAGRGDPLLAGTLVTLKLTCSSVTASPRRTQPTRCCSSGWFVSSLCHLSHLFLLEFLKKDSGPDVGGGFFLCKAA